MCYPKYSFCNEMSFYNFAIPWTVACLAPLSFTISWSFSNSCPLSQWYHPTFSSFITLFSYPQSFPASGSFPVSWLFASSDQIIGASVSASVLQMNIHGWFPLGLVRSIFSPRDSEESSPAPQFKGIHSLGDWCIIQQCF